MWLPITLVNSICIQAALWVRMPDHAEKGVRSTVSRKAVQCQHAAMLLWQTSCIVQAVRIK